MALRQDRRRRVLSDDKLAGAETVSDVAGSPATAMAESYAAAARRENQPHIVDLVPLGWLGQTLALLAGGATIVGLELVYTWLPEWRADLGDASLAALDLAGPGSLAHWLSAMLLAWAAGLGWLVYRLRSHRIDDYRGRYRVWRLLGPATLLLSINEIAPLDRLAAGLARLTLSGYTISHEQWWIFGAATCWLAVAIRATFEMRRSRGATISLLVATSVLLTAATLNQWAQFDFSSAEGVMLISGLRMFGHLLLFCAMSLYARHVILDAEGRLGSRSEPQSEAKAASRRKRRARPADDSPSDLEEASAPGKTAGIVDPPQKPRGPVHSPRTDLDSPRVVTRSASPRADAAPRATSDRPSPRPAPAARSVDSDDADSDAEGEGEDHSGANEYAGLTRAERKRFKRQQRQGRDAA